MPFTGDQLICLGRDQAAESGPTTVAWLEMLQTAWGSLFKSLRLGAGERLLASCFAGQITISPQVSGEPSLQFWCGKVDESTNFEGLLSAAEINDIHRQRRWFEAF